MDNFNLKNYLAEGKLIKESTGEEISNTLNEELNFSEYMKEVNVVGRSIAKAISGDDTDMYVDLVPKIENWFVDNVKKISNMGDAATEHISQKNK